MKRALLSIITIILLLTLTIGASATPPEGKGQDKERPVKTYRKELLEQKKELNQQLADLEEQLLTTTDPAIAMSIEEIKVQKKELINMMYAVGKTGYSDEDLASYTSAAGLIAHLYNEATILEAGSIIVNGGTIKLDTPPYIKGGRTVIPVRAVTESMGLFVYWDEELKTVTVTNVEIPTTTEPAVEATTEPAVEATTEAAVEVTTDDAITVVFTIGSPTVTVNTTAETMDSVPEITNSRTYVPIRFLAETFGLEVQWDEESQTIDIEDSYEGGPTTGGDPIDTTE